MPVFARRRTPTLARGVYTIQQGIGFLQAGDYAAALGCFRRVAASRHPKSTRLVRSVASFYAYNTERFRKESKKAKLGNANLMSFYPGNSGDAWSDVDIAAVLTAPSDYVTTSLLAAFLGRTVEAVRFQRRYAYGTTLNSWSAEKGTHYTRYTQNQRVATRLGVA